MQTQPQKILRIGVIQGGKIIEERLIRKREPVTIGTASKNTFSFPTSPLPKSYTLFHLRGQNYMLSFTDRMDGRISKGDTQVDFASLKSQGLARKKGAAYYLPLSEGTRGKVQIGDATLLFQFVTPPPMPARPHLPAVARGGLVKSIDWALATTVAGSFILHSALLLYLNSQPIPEKITFEEIPDRFANLIMPDKPKEEPKKEEGKEGGEKEKAKGKKGKKKRKEDISPEERARATAARKARIKKAVASKGLLKILGARGPSGAGGALADVFSSGGIDGDLDGVFSGVSGVAIATDSAIRTRKGGGGGDAADIGDLKTAGGGKVSMRGVVGAKISGIVRASTPEVEGGELDAKRVARVIKRNVRAVQSCYERQLKRNPKLAGKVEVSIEIGSSGRVNFVDIAFSSLNSSAAESCIKRALRRLRFPRPEGGSATVSFPFVFSPAS